MVKAIFSNSPLGNANPGWLWRGFTGHESLYEVNLINMNGRVYDPTIARMLSPDNYVQSPFSTQSYNCYSYVWNNPLKYNDPDGEFLNLAIGAGIGAITGWISGHKAGLRGGQLGNYVFNMAVIGALSGGVSSTTTLAASSSLHSVNGVMNRALSGMAGGMAGGFVAGVMTTDLNNRTFGLNNNIYNGGFKGAIIGGISGFILGGISGKLAEIKLEKLEYYESLNEFLEGDLYASLNNDNFGSDFPVDVGGSGDQSYRSLLRAYQKGKKFTLPDTEMIEYRELIDVTTIDKSWTKYDGGSSYTKSVNIRGQKIDLMVAGGNYKSFIYSVGLNSPSSYTYPTIELQGDSYYRMLSYMRFAETPKGVRLALVLMRVINRH